MPLTIDLMDPSVSSLIPLDLHSASDFIPHWALSPPNMTQLLENIEQLQSYQKKHTQAISELQKLATIAQRSSLPWDTAKKGVKGPDEAEDQGPALVLIDCTSVAFDPELVEQGREGGKKLVDNLTRQIEANYAETRKDDDAKEIWTCFELFVSENFAEGNGQQARKMKEFLKGVTDAINVKLVRVFDDNTTGLAWKLAVTAQNWFERNPARYCYVASCDEKTYGCFNSANRTRLKLLAQQAADPEDIDDLEEYEETRKRRGGFEMVDVGTLLMPKGFEEEDLEVISTALVQSPLIDEVKVSVQVDKSIEKARETVRKPLAPPRTAYDLVKHCLGQSDRIKVGAEISKQAMPVKPPLDLKAPVRAPVSARPNPPPALVSDRVVVLPEPPHPRLVSVPPKAVGSDIKKALRQFRPLYAVLIGLNKDHLEYRYHEAGQVGQRLGASEYRRAGFTCYKDYVLAAQKSGIVKVIFEGSAVWVALNVAQVQHQPAASKQTDSDDTRKGSSSDPIWLSNIDEPVTPRTVGAPYWITEPDSPPISLV